MDARLKRQILNVARDVAMTVAGLTMAVTPLALWASPTLTAFYTVLITCGIATCVVLIISELGPDEPRSGHRRDTRVSMSPRLVRDLQNQRELGRKDLPELRRFVQDNSKPQADNKD